MISGNPAGQSEFSFLCLQYPFSSLVDNRMPNRFRLFTHLMTNSNYFQTQTVTPGWPCSSMPGLIADGVKCIDHDVTSSYRNNLDHYISKHYREFLDIEKGFPYLAIEHYLTINTSYTGQHYKRFPGESPRLQHY